MSESPPRRLAPEPSTQIYEVVQLPNKHALHIVVPPTRVVSELGHPLIVRRVSSSNPVAGKIYRKIRNIFRSQGSGDVEPLPLGHRSAKTAKTGKRSNVDTRTTHVDRPKGPGRVGR